MALGLMKFLEAPESSSAVVYRLVNWGLIDLNEWLDEWFVGYSRIDWELA